MSLNIDEIYDLLTWDASLSEKENEEREKRGIAEASKLKNIYPFIQPILADAKDGRNPSKSAWESCAKVVAMRTDEELDPYIYLLLKWLQDMNWPGADIIFQRHPKSTLTLLSIGWRFACAWRNGKMISFGWIL